MTEMIAKYFEVYPERRTQIRLPSSTQELLEIYLLPKTQKNIFLNKVFSLFHIVSGFPKNHRSFMLLPLLIVFILSDFQFLGPRKRALMTHLGGAEKKRREQEEEE